MTDPRDIFDRRLLIQSGKGGTGKTTISAGLAVLAARRGKRVLLVEVDTRDRFAPLFGRSEPVGYEVTEVRPGISALNLDPQLVMVDFLRTHIRVRAIWRQIADSRIFQYFYAAAPGLRELICLGKVWRLLGEMRRGRPEWDMVILDAPATGHGLAIFNVAQVASETLYGPMRANAEKIRDMLRDEATTVLNICAIPEEMPVNEAVDLHRAVVEELRMPLGLLFMNAVTPPLLDQEEADALFEAGGERGERLASMLGGGAAVQALARSARARADRAEVAGRHAARARERVPLPMVQLPFIYDADFDEGTLETIADELEAALAMPRPRKQAAGHEGDAL